MISAVEITNFRGVEQGKLQEFTPLVVLVGSNSSGKSTVLDALYIGASPTPGEAISQIMNRRHELVRGKGRWLLRNDAETAEVTVFVNAVNFRTVNFRRSHGDPNISLGIDTTDDGRLVRASGSISIDGGASYPARSSLADISSVRLVEFDIATPLHEAYSATVRQGRREEAKAIVNAVTGANSLEILIDNGAPTVYLNFEHYAVPAALAGDGVRSLLRLALELASSSGGVVLLEEPEVHQHPGAMVQSAKVIWAAIRRDIQVIITTHSLELIDALLAEVESDEELEKLTLFRLQLRDGCLKSNRVVGSDIAFARVQIGDDLR